MVAGRLAGGVGATRGVGRLLVEAAPVEGKGAEDLVGPRAPGLSMAIEILDRRIPAYDLLLIAIGPVVLAAMWLLLSRTRWGALAATLWTAAAVLAVAVLQAVVPPPPPGAPVSILSVAGVDVISRATSGTTVLGLLPVVPMTLISALLLVAVSRFTPASRPVGRRRM